MKRLVSMFRTPDGQVHAGTFLLVCGIFVCTGLCNGMIDSLNKHFQNSFAVSKAASALVQFFWYLAYFLLALPSGWFARRFGYRAGIVTGLTLVFLGCLIVYPATLVNTFAAFLAILFLIASGLTVLETIANPYATVLGPPDSGVARINFAQSCNAIGWILGPWLVGWFVLSGTARANTSNHALYLPYLVVAVLVGTLALAFRVAPVPDIRAPAEDRADAGGRVRPRPLVQQWHFTLAIASQFLYCAGQTGVFSFFINYVKDYMPAIPAGVVEALPPGMCYAREGLWHATDQGAAALLSFGGFTLFMLGRFTGSALLRFASPHITLGIYGLVNTVLMATVILAPGWVSIFALLLSFFFMSIIYPTNFALGIRGLGARTKLASSFMVMAILGGAVAPMFMGRLADRFSMRVGFLVPAVCFSAVMAYGFLWNGFFSRDMMALPNDNNNQEAKP
jgi:FHS family L-fucose permease-like MFS transporter